MMAAALDLDHPALADSDEALLPTYLEGYDAETVAQLLERVGQGPPAEDDRRQGDAAVRGHGMPHGPRPAAHCA